MNWRELMARVRSWLTPDGRFFMHIFTHRSGAYLFDRADGEDWIAQHFFTGGVMPSHHLIRQYADLFEVEKEWRWSGTHYQRTALDWLANFDAHRDEIEGIFRDVYGDDTALWMRRWRWFFLATAGLFGYADGSEWGVSHYPDEASAECFPQRHSQGLRIFTSSAWTNSLPQTTWPVFSGSSSPSMPLTMPPASRTMIWPAAMSQGCRLRSQ